MQTIRILMLAGTMAIPFQAAEAQLLFGSRRVRPITRAMTPKSSCRLRRTC